MVTIPGFGEGLLGKVSAAIGTPWYAVIPPRGDAFARLFGFQYTNGATLNDFTLMRAIGRARVTPAVAAGGPTLVLDADPSPAGNTIAAGDQCIVQHSDGTYRRYQVNTGGWAAGTKTVTFTANLAAAVAANAKLFFCGIFSDTDPLTGVPFPVVTPTATGTYVLSFAGCGYRGAEKGEPILVYNPNTVAQTTVNYFDTGHTAN